MMNIIFAHILAHIQNIHDIHFAYLNIVNLLVNMTRIPQALNAPNWSFSFRFIFTSYSLHILTKYYGAYSLHIHVLFGDIHLGLIRAPDIHDRYLQC